MKKTKIIYMVGGPLTQRWLDYYCLDDMAENFDVEFWDCSQIIEYPYHVNGVIQREYVYEVKSRDDFITQLKTISSNSLFIFEIGLISTNYHLLKLISKYLKYCVNIDIWTLSLLRVINNTLPKSLSDIPKKKKSFKDVIYQYDFVRIFVKFLRYGPTSSFVTYIHQLMSGASERKELKKENAISTMFKFYEMSYNPDYPFVINHPDYEKYVKLKDKQERHDRYVVYIGQYYPLHAEFIERYPDLHLETIAPSFYRLLNRTFEKIEKMYDCKVVIAEHPSGKYQINPYNGREIIFYKTAELVRDSIGVLMHCSNSFSFAALWDKPIAILDCDVMHMTHMGNATLSFSKALHTKIIKMDTNDDINGALEPIDRDVLKQYLHYFPNINNSNVVLNSELFIKHFKSIFQDIIRHNG